MLNLKNIFHRQGKFDDVAASIWFGAAVPLVLAVSVTVAWLVSWFDVAFLSWLFEPIGLAVFGLVAAGGWIFPVFGVVLARRGLKNNKNVAVASLFLSISELVFYVVVIGSVYLNSNNFID